MICLYASAAPQAALPGVGFGGAHGSPRGGGGHTSSVMSQAARLMAATKIISNFERFKITVPHHPYNEYSITHIVVVPQ
jgi:hypothetical protein